MTPEDAHYAIRAAIRRRQDLRWRGSPPPDPMPEWADGPYGSFCYIATEAFCALVPDAIPWCTETRGHFWAMVDGDVWDLTEEQFKDGFDHEQGHRTHFKQVSARAQELIREAIIDHEAGMDDLGDDWE